MSRSNLVTFLLVLCLAIKISSALRTGNNFEGDDSFASNSQDRSRINSVARDLGDKTVSEGAAQRIALLTPYGRIVVNLDDRNAPEMVNLMLRKAKSTHKTCSGCKFYRAEARPGGRGPAEGPPYGLIQGSLSTLKNAQNIVKKEGTREVKSGDFVMIPGTYDFYIALIDHPGWGSAHTVVGQVEDFVVADLIGVQPFTSYKHPTQGTVMRMMTDKVPFIVTDDFDQLVMPRVPSKHSATIKLGTNEEIAGLKTKENVDADDVFVQDDIDSREDELTSNEDRDELLNGDREFTDDELDREVLEEGNDADFVDEELERTRETAMKRGQTGGSLNRNRGRNGQKNRRSRVQDAFENLNGEDDLDEFESVQDEFEDEEDDFAKNDVAEEMVARYNKPPPSVRARMSHKSNGAQTSKRAESNIESKSYYMEEDVDYNVEDGYDDGNERDGGALAFQHHDEAPERRAISRDFEEDSDYQDNFNSRHHGNMNGERRRDSKGGKKSTSGGNVQGRRMGGGTKRDGLPF